MTRLFGDLALVARARPPLLFVAGDRVVMMYASANRDEAVFEEVRAIRDGGGFGSIIGRNSFQRRKPDALAFLRTVMGIYAGTQK